MNFVSQSCRIVRQVSIAVSICILTVIWEKFLASAESTNNHKFNEYL